MFRQKTECQKQRNANDVEYHIIKPTNMEKTFEELIEALRINPYNEYLNKYEVLKLLKQVREATIAECRDIASEFSLSETLKHIDNLPTDRIKTEK